MSSSLPSRCLRLPRRRICWQPRVRGREPRLTLSENSVFSCVHIHKRNPNTRDIKGKPASGNVSQVLQRTEIISWQSVSSEYIKQFLLPCKPKMAWKKKKSSQVRSFHIGILLSEILQHWSCFVAYHTLSPFCVEFAFSPCVCVDFQTIQVFSHFRLMTSRWVEQETNLH